MNGAGKSKPNIIKTHAANVVTGGITMIPRPITRSAVYIVRDPRDVVSSYARHMKLSVDEAIVSMDKMEAMMARNNVGTWVTSWSNHVNSWERDFVNVIRYEDLKKNPEKYFTKILETFGITVRKKQVKRAVKLCALEKLKKQEEKDAFIEKGLSDKFFGEGMGWKAELTDKQIRRIEEDHGEVMEKLGYL